MIALVLAAALLSADDRVDRGVELYEADRCNEARPLLESEAPRSARAAYFLGTCLLEADAFDAAARAFEQAAHDDDWRSLSRLMRGIALYRAGRYDESLPDLEASTRDAELSDELRVIARELLDARPGRKALSAAVYVGAEGDSNVMQGPGTNEAGLPVVAAPVLTLTALALWQPHESLQVTTTLLRREVLGVAEASVGGLLAQVEWIGRPREWLELAARLDGSGLVLDWSPFSASAGVSGGARWTPFAALTIGAGGRARLERYAGEFNAQSGPEWGVSADVEARVAGWKAGLGADHLQDDTLDPDFVRAVDGAAAFVERALGPVLLRARASFARHGYRHANTLRDREGRRTARVDHRSELGLSAEWPMPWGLEAAADASWTTSLSSIAVYDYERALVRLGVTRAF